MPIAGLKEEQAKAIALEMQKIDLEHVATKQDIQVAIDRLEIRMLRFIIPTLLGQAAVFAVIVKLLLG